MFEKPYFTNSDKAREHLEAIRWAHGPECPHCGSVDNSRRLEGKSHRPGLLKCRDCNKQYTVTVGTVFERSKIPLHKWFQAVYLLCSSKKGMSSHQLHRTLGVTYKTAWFMAHRIREAMREGTWDKLGGDGGLVEADETYIGGKKKTRGGYAHKEAVVSLVERGGKVRSVHVPKVNAASLRPILTEQIAKEANLRTDKANYYASVGKEFASHLSVDHGIGEYVRGDAHTNTLEGYFAILKRGIKGIYQHVGPYHLKRYLGEFDFRYNTRKISDWERTEIALKGISGKRLTYGGPQTA